MQIIGHSGKARGNDPSDIISSRIHHVKRNSRAEIDDHDRRTKTIACSKGVSEAVRTDGVGPGIIDPNAVKRFGIEFEAPQIPQAFDCTTNEWSGSGDNAAENRAV